MPSRSKLAQWLQKDFAPAGADIEPWTPQDFTPDPAFLANVSDPSLREFARAVVSIWPDLGKRAVPQTYGDRTSLLPLPNGFIAPGGRFREPYYWDSYFILRGLLLSEMHQTARGMIGNLLSLADSLGFVPNGARVYYSSRSQPPFLALMVRDYFAETQDQQLVADALPVLSRE